MRSIVKNGKFMQIYSPKEITKQVQDTLEYYQARAERLEEENTRLYVNARAVVEQDVQEEIASLKKRIHLSYGEFASEKELERYWDFTRRHMHNRAESRANGGKAPYLIPDHTGVGTVLKVKCQICGEEEDITDTEVW